MIEVRPLSGEGDPALERLPFSRLGQPDGEYLVAWDDADPIGHAYLDWHAGVPELQDVYVAEDRRRRGVGTALTLASERRAAERGHDRLALEVGQDSPAARALYEKLGYRATGATRRVKGTIMIRGGPLDVDDTLIAMVKSLA